MLMKRLALGAIILIVGLIAPVYAADLGGNCCSDLEERIAELETTTARKGNRKMSVTVYGQVHKSIMWHDIDNDALARPIIGDGSQQPTLFGFQGDAKISPEVKAGFRIEFGADENRISGEDIVVRHSNVWVESMTVGRLTLGRGSVATDGIAEITTANTDVASKMLNLEPFSSQFLGGQVNLPFDGGRRDVIRYDSPVMAGFMASASWGKGDHVGPFNLNGEGSNVWHVALRYAGEVGDFRIMAGVGYRDEDYSAVGPLVGLPQGPSITGSASVKHMTSGVFASAAYGQIKDFALENSNVDLTGMHVQGGWEKNVFGGGNTTVFGEWAQLKMDVGGGDGTVDMMGFSAVQAIDAAALDLYISWRQYDMTEIGMDDKINTFMGGARIRF